VKPSAYTNCMHPSLQDTSWRFWCWWVDGNSWSDKSCLCLCSSTTSPTKVSQNVSVDDAHLYTHWNPIYWKQDGELIYYESREWTILHFCIDFMSLL